MKKALALFLSLVIVFAFTGCSFKYNVFQNIEQKSKRFKDVNLSVKSMEVLEENDEYGFTIVSATGEDFIFLVYYDSEEYKTSFHPKIISLSFNFLNDITSSDDEKIFLNTCKSILLIDDWGLTIGDLKELKKKGSFSVETESGENLEIRTDSNPCHLSVYTDEMWAYY